MTDDEDILEILTSPAPGIRDGGAGEGALKEFQLGFHDGWLGAPKKRRNGIYSRAYLNGVRAKKESTYFQKPLDGSA